MEAVLKFESVSFLFFNNWGCPFFPLPSFLHILLLLLFLLLNLTVTTRLSTYLPSLCWLSNFFTSLYCSREDYSIGFKKTIGLKWSSRGRTQTKSNILRMGVAEVILPFHSVSSNLFSLFFPLLLVCICLGLKGV